ncbi:hypothetical protein OHB41_01700 [Streptomyces sp. NBC_01571]|uniref:hypothetical protein n=1 Tax=Streptomyces sp. NBC_01571 TaxID=2975883 RepID=UPI00224F2F2C|nr:hypothetical protein [Streptomyces sp. NBC_01571]MCX4571924.1 hypothetical protein [Streptomyces sp. NBC_01571]
MVAGRNLAAGWLSGAAMVCDCLLTGVVASLNNLSNRLGEAGLAASEEAVRHYRALANLHGDLPQKLGAAVPPVGGWRFASVPPTMAMADGFGSPAIKVGASP